LPLPPGEDLFILPDEYKSCLRPKRSLLKSHRNEELNVETLVVVDKKMMQNHGHGNVTTYVLTVLNMVGHLREPALGLLCALPFLPCTWGLGLRRKKYSV
jgi:thrombospondin motif-containing protein 16